jgi:uncharacterized membrane protein YheB (UPF0754 family)
MSNENQSIERLVKEQLVSSEIQRIKDKLRPIVRAELESYLDTKEFRSGLRKCVREDLAERLSEYWSDYVPPKKWKKLMMRAVNGLLR